MQYRLPSPNYQDTNLYTVRVSPLLPGDFIAILPIEIPLLRFRELTISLPVFITLIPETVFQYIMKNINGQTSNFEWVLIKLMEKVADDFLAAGYPEDPVVIRLAEVAVGAFIYEIQGLIANLGLLDECRLFHFKVAFFNKYEAVLYDSRLRSNATPTTVGII